MEKLPRPYDKEFMRMTMLEHEETFKEQVYELHRLYRNQKILMKSIQTSRPNGNGRRQELWNSSESGMVMLRQNNHQPNSSRRRLDLERPAEEYNIVAESDGNNRTLEMIDESEIELTLGPTSYARRKKHSRTPPLTSDSGPSFSSSSTDESSHIDRTSSMTHQRANATPEELNGRHQLGLLHGTDSTLGYQSGSKNIVDIEEQLRQERLNKQPSPWLFQVLSLNMT